MAITLNDFKKGGCLRSFVAKIGLLDKIDKGDIDQTILLSRLVKDIMPINVIEDPEGKIASFDENNPDPSVFDTMEINPIIKPEPGPTPPTPPTPEPDWQEVSRQEVGDRFCVLDPIHQVNTGMANVTYEVTYQDMNPESPTYGEQKVETEQVEEEDLVNCPIPTGNFDVYAYVSNGDCGIYDHYPTEYDVPSSKEDTMKGIEAGTKVWIYAVPTSNHEFKEWRIKINGETYTYFANPLEWTVYENSDFNGDCISNQVSISVEANGEGFVAINNSNPDKTYDQLTVTRHTPVTLYAQPNSDYDFMGWNDGNMDSVRTVIALDDIDYIATFKKHKEPGDHTLTVTLNHHECNVKVNDGDWYGYPELIDTFNAGDDITLYQQADTSKGYVFDHWYDHTEKVEYYTDSFNFTMPASNVTVDAIFKHGHFIYITENDESVGQVEAYNQTTGESTTGTNFNFFVDDQTHVTLTPVPAEGFMFDHWVIDGNDDYDNPKTLYVKENYTVHAIFIEDTSGSDSGSEYEIYTYVSKDGYQDGGTVQIDSEPAGETCTKYVDEGSNVTLYANTNSGYRFDRWSDGNTDNPRYLYNVKDNISLGAIFVIDDLPSIDDSGSGDGVRNYNVNITFSNQGDQVDKAYINSLPVSDNDNLAITEGESITIDVTTIENWQVTQLVIKDSKDNVLEEGISQPIVPYTYSGVYQDLRIFVAVNKTGGTLYITQPENGNINLEIDGSPVNKESVFVNKDSSINISVTANDGYEVTSLSVLKNDDNSPKEFTINETTAYCSKYGGEDLYISAIITEK